MFKGVLSLTVLSIMLLTTTILADGEFFGYVDYKNCDCSPYHQVKIRKADDSSEDYHRVRCGGNPGYNTRPYVYTTGWYYISVVGLGLTECETSRIEYVYHVGGEEHRVDLTVYGPQEQPTGPEGGE